MLCCRGTSIKTRIETPKKGGLVDVAELVAEEHPLKQGLKPLLSRIIVWCIRVAEEHPLKQGLKQCDTHPVQSFIRVAEEHPLKQGLKRYVLLACYFILFCCRGTSIKTRIETVKIYKVNEIFRDCVTGLCI